jgi:hypothetical protein
LIDQIDPLNERRVENPSESTISITTVKDDQIELNSSNTSEENKSCTSCQNKVSYVYSLGRIYFNYPNESVRNEVAQARFRAGIEMRVPEREGLYQLFTGKDKDEYLYLSRQLCWIFALGRIETYILLPSTQQDHDVLISTLQYSERDILQTITNEPVVNLLIGQKGPISPMGMCGNLALPMIRIDQVGTYRLADLNKVLIDSYDDKMGIGKQKYEDSLNQVFSKLWEISENEGSTDESRAINYLIMRSMMIYQQSAIIQVKENSALENIFTKPVKTVGSRKIVEVILSFKSSSGLTDMYSIDVDVSGEFPFLLGGLKRYLDAMR